MYKPIWKNQWNDAMSVGIPEVDEEHKHFITLVNGFNEAVGDRVPMTEIKKKLQEIIDDAKQHFAHEERLFKEWHYPDSDEHANIHLKIIKELQDIKMSSIPYGLDSEWIEAGMKIEGILMSHILHEDKKYADFHQNLRTSGNEKIV